MTLTEFLLARIAEDEAQAEDAKKLRYSDESEAHWSYNGNPSGAIVGSHKPGLIGQVSTWEPTDDGGRFARHIANWDPARVLAECQAKRRIVELHTGLHECVGDRHGSRDTVYVAPGYQHEVDPTLRLLALPYNNHPDYLQEWAL